MRVRIIGRGDRLGVAVLDAINPTGKPEWRANGHTIEPSGKTWRIMDVIAATEQPVDVVAARLDGLRATDAYVETWTLFD